MKRQQSHCLFSWKLIKISDSLSIICLIIFFIWRTAEWKLHKYRDNYGNLKPKVLIGQDHSHLSQHCFPHKWNSLKNSCRLPAEIGLLSRTPIFLQPCLIKMYGKSFFWILFVKFWRMSKQARMFLF